MSSPISSLKKGKRTPLDPRQVQVPFRNTAHNADETTAAFSKKDGLSKLPKSSSSTTVPSDRDLLGSMMSRLAQVEQQLKNAQTQLLEKDKKIHILEEKAKLLEKARGYNSGTITELEKKCKRLQTQVFQMEDFLADYGMVWVGDDNADSDYDVLEETPSSVPSSLSRQQQVWNPNSSVVNTAAYKLKMNFDVVLKNIRELNILAGEGCSEVSRTKDGARLKVRDSVPLTLYSNGILMFGGPFRPYSDPVTQQCMQDLMDGFFPSELQARYPDGVPFEVQDKRDVVFEDRRTALLFPGTGQSLVTEEDVKNHKVESQTPGQKQQSVDQFLSRLPQSVIKDGKIIDVRSGVANVIKGGEGHSDVKVLDTPVLQEIKSRSTDGPRPQSGTTQVSTLRIKSETGEMTYILKMKFTDCIRDVRNHIDAVRPADAPLYDIKTSFPNRVYDDPTATLQECGLVPNATLHLLAKKV
ncbi:UBX domain-containing protein 11-like isoform X1 [Orbicella faveolata]|uniref:UBX domain-containing protein 11-like isoform X1 n=1 Tax=Orbicella faveolata TaxID=48498 RepID=UPI0009E33BC0|nr:UBX domain-containing protein 11-like isoform X1 [Orbicella faveolata]